MDAPSSLFFVPQQKFTRKAISLAVKKRIIDASSSGMPIAELRERFNLPNSTIRKILSIRQKVQQAIDQGADGSRAKLTGTRNPELEQAVREWLQAARAEGIPVNGPCLKAKAMEFAAALKITRFKASEGWLNNFKQRHPVLFGKTPGPSFVINQPDGPIEWPQNAAANSNELLAKFLTDNLFQEEEVNVDQTGGCEEESIEASTGGRELECSVSDLSNQLLPPTSNLPSANQTATEQRASLQDAYTGFSVLRQYIEENSADNELMSACHRISDYLYTERQNLRRTGAL